MSPKCQNKLKSKVIKISININTENVDALKTLRINYLNLDMGIVQINDNNNRRNKIFFHSEGPHLFCVAKIVYTPF